MNAWRFVTTDFTRNHLNISYKRKENNLDMATKVQNLGLFTKRKVNITDNIMNDENCRLADAREIIG